MNASSQISNPWASGLSLPVLNLIRDRSKAMARGILSSISKAHPEEAVGVSPEMKDAFLDVWFLAGCRLWSMEDHNAKEVSIDTWLKHLKAVHEFMDDSSNSQPCAAIA